MAAPASFDLSRLRSRLAGRAPRRAFRLLSPRRAAVAVVLDPKGCVLLTRRAARAGNPWAGQVSLPGGMAQASDGSALGTAVRETREEVGVDLADPDGAALLGPLDEVRAMSHSGLRPLVISPLVFLASTRPAASLGLEVVSVFWLPLAAAASGALDSRLRFPVLGIPVRFACWRNQGEVVWGLTYGILRALIRLGT
ncbi:MAG: CoA pyrophosphatase [Myxococcales bacterium]